MKLYTERQIRRALNAIEFNPIANILIEQMTPIELPSDEEIKKEMEFDWLDPEDVAYLGGAIWMRDLIQGGNNEQ